MKHLVTSFSSILAMVLTGLSAACAAASALPRSTPEAEGVSSVEILKLIDGLDDELESVHSVMILRHGKVITEGWWHPYAPEHNHVLYSLSKSFTSTAVGFAVTEGKLEVDDKVLKFFPEEAPADASANLKAMRVRDLLTMTTGHKDVPPTSPDTVSARSFLAKAVPYQPGTHFKYNTAATFMQSAIVQKLTGQTVLDYLRPRLFSPLGIDRPMWETNHQGISLGGYGLRVRTEDIAKFGQLYLQKGHWNGQQLLPEQWIEMATRKQVANGTNPKSDWNQGYGFQFWRCRHDAYRGDGAFGQFCIVIPQQKVVVAVTSGLRDMGAVMNLVWNRLLPALQDDRLPPNEKSLVALNRRLKGLALTPVEGNATTKNQASAFNRNYEFSKNDQRIERVSLDSADAGKTVTLKMRWNGQTVMIPAGYRQWRKGRTAFPGGRLARYHDEPVVGSFSWRTDDTVVVKVCAYETPFVLTYTLKFEGDKLTLDAESNVAFGPTKRPTLTGRSKR